jgi:uncharacterized protein YqjF (DUF2071 family)
VKEREYVRKEKWNIKLEKEVLEKGSLHVVFYCLYFGKEIMVLNSRRLFAIPYLYLMRPKMLRKQ